MTTWHSEPDETMLSQDLVVFATGAAPKVSGMRWFRDTQRHDIQKELPEWPEGPQYTVRTPRERRTRTATRFGLYALYAAVVGVLETLAGSGSITKGPNRLNASPEDPDNEVDDFPVMWADPGTIARTLPWQLDSGRRSVSYRTFAILTDRRLLILGSPDGSRNPTEFLWECDRSYIAGAEVRKFSRDNSDATIRFTDESWCRLHFFSTGLQRYLITPNELIGLDALSSGQRVTLDAFMKKHAFGSTPVVSRRPSGNFLIEGRAGDAPRPRNALTTAFQLMGPDGETVEAQAGDY
ncbi:hypothetical protein OG760_21040 [Streptomyces sp. NBC_00963]|uniref:hypothetical protein n=1 Tax=Streptomyces sp. NBC_00963 TaxID=2903697 RepID=UPI003866D1F9|nr:hypothetical protein OG760_21040 [Streptomyces sp. NBC_00963]